MTSVVSDVRVPASRAPHARASTPRRPWRGATLTRRASTTEASASKTQYTYLGGNSWFAQLGVSGVKVLCDPWLVGDLTFWDLPALYTGRKASLEGSNDWMRSPRPPMSSYYRNLGRTTVTSHPARAAKGYPSGGITGSRRGGERIGLL